MKVDTLPALHEVRAQPAPRAAAAPPRPEIAELLICSAQGDVLCEWQCRRPDLWIGLFEFISQKAQRLAHGLALGDFDRLELQTEEGRAVVIIGADRGVLVRTRQAPPVEVQTASARPGDRSAVAGWLRQAPAVRGALVRGVRFADQTFLCDVDSRDFPAAALEQGWRSVADTFQVLATHGFPPRRLAWHYQRAVLHCAQHADGTLFGAFAARKREEVDADGLERTLKAFAALAAAAP
jgi:hypothetical protein